MNLSEKDEIGNNGINKNKMPKIGIADSILKRKRSNSMVRGVSRQIIEVPDTGNIYYEKAYLVVKPEFSDAQRTLLEKEAKRVLRAMDAPSSIKQKKKKMDDCSVFFGCSTGRCGNYGRLFFLILMVA